MDEPKTLFVSFRLSPRDNRLLSGAARLKKISKGQLIRDAIRPVLNKARKMAE